jgi:hypothetical protein
MENKIEYILKNISDIDKKIKQKHKELKGKK